MELGQIREMTVSITNKQNKRSYLRDFYMKLLRNFHALMYNRTDENVGMRGVSKKSHAKNRLGSR